MLTFNAFAVVSLDPEDISKHYMLACHPTREMAEQGMGNARTLWTMAAVKEGIPDETYDRLMAAIRSLRVIEVRVNETVAI